MEVQGDVGTGGRGAMTYSRWSKAPKMQGLAFKTRYIHFYGAHCCDHHPTKTPFAIKSKPYEAKKQTNVATGGLMKGLSLVLFYFGRN